MASAATTATMTAIISFIHDFTLMLAASATWLILFLCCSAPHNCSSRWTSKMTNIKVKLEINIAKVGAQHYGLFGADVCSCLRINSRTHYLHEANEFHSSLLMCFFIFYCCTIDNLLASCFFNSNDYGPTQLKQCTPVLCHNTDNAKWRDQQNWT